jgi:hypothetical protein
MANVIYDKLHDFGTVTTPATGTFPNILNMGEASAERMTVDFHCAALVGGTDITFRVGGCDTESGSYMPIVVGGAIPMDELNAGVYQLPLPRTKFKFLKAYLTVTGTFTGGTVQAILNTYVGK